MKLTVEEKELLSELVEHPGIKALFKDMEGVMQAMAGDLVKYNCNSDTAERELLRMKFRSEGAAKLLDTVKRRLESLKTAKDKRS
jgi:hypothetical protein